MRLDAAVAERLGNGQRHGLAEMFSGAVGAQGVSLTSMLLKPSMVIAGSARGQQASVEEMAIATLAYLRRQVPAAVPGIVFLSGGQSERLATAHLNASNRLARSRPWKTSFSYGRALQGRRSEAGMGATRT